MSLRWFDSKLWESDGWWPAKPTADAVSWHWPFLAPQRDPFEPLGICDDDAPKWTCPKSEDVESCVDHEMDHRNIRLRMLRLSPSNPPYPCFSMIGSTVLHSVHCIRTRIKSMVFPCPMYFLLGLWDWDPISCLLAWPWTQSGSWGSTWSWVLPVGCFAPRMIWVGQPTVVTVPNMVRKLYICMTTQSISCKIGDGLVLNARH